MLSDRMTLQARFDRLWTRIVGADRCVRAWNRLDAGYGAGSRAYHGWTHIAAMLADLDTVREDPEFADVSFEAVELAVFFHDAVYEPQRHDNEAASAVLFAEEAADRLSPEGAEQVRALILATARHNPGTDPSTRLLIDLDLAVLGGSPSSYTAYAAAIRREYAHVCDDAWRVGRSMVLRRFLDRAAIFQSRSFANRSEASARTNLARELAILES